MDEFPHIETGALLFRFMDHRTPYFWPAITEMLSNHSLVLNARRNFNDPFDSQPVIENDLSNRSIRDYFNEALNDPLNPRRSLQAAASILEIRASGKTSLTKKRVDNIREALRKNAQETLDSAGLLSFSQTAENPLLWGHYAASFTGVCAVFRRSASLKSGLAACAKVAYVRKRPRLPLSIIHEMTRRRMAHESYDDLATKSFLFHSCTKASIGPTSKKLGFFTHSMRSRDFLLTQPNWSASCWDLIHPMTCTLKLKMK